MLFNSLEFIFLFLPITLFIFFFLGKYGYHRLAITWLVTASLFFYGWWNPRYLLLLLVSIGLNFFIGYTLNQLNSPIRKKTLLVLGITANLIILCCFKYANFFVSSAADILGINFNLQNIILPLGISFFTFQQITYLVDSYREEAKDTKFVDYCLFITFFPKLISGPIVHHSEIMPQFADKAVCRFNLENMAVGITIFSLGLFKKVVFADNIAAYASPVFNTAAAGIFPTFLESWVGALAYTLQLYFDFSGYSDMAIGIARMFGIKLPVNFFSPYKATSISDFWRRWHITLSNFLRDYLYIPLGGNRKGEIRRSLNLMITMLLGGIWHGEGWQFVFWGGLHGAYLSINHEWNVFQKKYDLKTDNWLSLKLGWFITFLAVVIGWVFFRAENMATAFIIVKGMIGLNGLLFTTQILESGLKKAIIDISILLAIVWLTPNVQEWMGKYEPVFNYEKLKKLSSNSLFWSRLQWQPNQTYALVVSVLTVIALLHLTKVSEFLYFQF
ncbi:alginate O-acetylation protein [Nostoc commune NIES-4072]|uniref:Alginate O-acetylation protein n=1 Tax=Nostoc commune NIES-4072 TaxID=2005467 RepID=A0A2R5FV30_NOSCO|nr:MBOAT family protein [Nostoc commune]BBD67128.1 alginate O-acetylation protein [Nostoc commune HK-02]GBG21889.1 alginate O-acetylation protein [Nostoc commune NIES-4072]